MIVGLTHSGFSVSDLDSALDFFKDKLGIEEIRSQLSDQEYLSRVTGFPGARLKIGFVRKEGDAFPLEVIEYLTPQGVPSRAGIGIVGTQHRCYEVGDLDALYARLKNQSISFLSEPRDLGESFWTGARGVFFYGPDQTIFEFLETSLSKEGKPEIKRIHHLGLTVSNTAAALELLCGVLGLEKVGDIESSWEYLKFPGFSEDTRLKSTLLKITGTEAVS